MIKIGVGGCTVSVVCKRCGGNLTAEGHTSNCYYSRPPAHIQDNGDGAPPIADRNHDRWQWIPPS